MIIGYARTSTIDQKAGFEAQVSELTTAGCEKLYREQVSSVERRDQLEAAIDFAREGDTLVVTKLDRLARSVENLIQVERRLRRKGASLRVLNMGIDTGTATGRLMMNVVGAVGQFEREIMLERQREGIAKAKAGGKYKGRKPTARAKTRHVQLLHKDGVAPAEIARRLEISRASVYRCLAD